MAQVRTSLAANPDYAAALAAKQAARDDAIAFHEKGENPAVGDISVIAQRGLEAGQRVTAIEREAMAKDSKVTAAQSPAGCRYRRSQRRQ